MFSKLKVACDLLRHLGPGWCFDRIGYELRKRSGVVRRRLPVANWEDHPAEAYLSDRTWIDADRYCRFRRECAPRFFFAAADRPAFLAHFREWDASGPSPLESADKLDSGVVRYFQHHDLHVGWPPQWHVHPLEQIAAPHNRHWSEISDFDHGDIKVLWEPARFADAYLLVRAYWRNQNERYAELFWDAVEDWRNCNPPQQGVHWKCGQEISFRVMAWCFGLYGFLESPASTPERLSKLLQMIAVSGQRIAANISYALSQNNNHGISEACGLWTIGLLFPELAEATHWKNLGRRHLESQGRSLIYSDGSFSQHSTNYHRVMLQLYLWSWQLGKLSNEPLSPQLHERLQRAGNFLYQIQDEASGRVPCYGQNDGALVLPLSNCDYQDFRPVVQAAELLTEGARRYGSGPWDEESVWLLGTGSLSANRSQAPRHSFSAADGGYYTLRSHSGFVFTRAPNFRHRPAQADALHMDLWWKGQNIALDPGTYSYNAPAPWNGSLGRTAYHNTVSVDNLDQMDQVSRFLWLPWLHSQVARQCNSPGGHFSYWEASHDGYCRLPDPVHHRRGVLRMGDEHWLVLDSLEGRRVHELCLQWLLGDYPYEWDETCFRLLLKTQSGPYQLQVASEPCMKASLMRADPEHPRGWRSAYYQQREAALSARFSAHSESVNCWSLFGPPGSRMVLGQQDLRVETPHWTAEILRSGRQSTLQNASVRGQVCDALAIEEAKCQRKRNFWGASGVGVST